MALTLGDMILNPYATAMTDENIYTYGQDSADTNLAKADPGHFSPPALCQAEPYTSQLPPETESGKPELTDVSFSSYQEAAAGLPPYTSIGNPPENLRGPESYPDAIYSPAPRSQDIVEQSLRVAVEGHAGDPHGSLLQESCEANMALPPINVYDNLYDTCW